MKIQITNYGSYQHLVVKNEEGKITACLYILLDGTTHGDSWIKPSGW